MKENSTQSGGKLNPAHYLFISGPDGRNAANKSGIPLQQGRHHDAGECGEEQLEQEYRHRGEKLEHESACGQENLFIPPTLCVRLFFSGLAPHQETG